MGDKERVTVIEDGAIHGFFGLSYAQYLTIPRTVLQSMPLEWQDRFVEMLREMNELLPHWMPKGSTYYQVYLRDDETGRYVTDPLADYERGRRRLPLARLCQLCGKPMGDEAGDTHKACGDYEAYQADKDS